jgi:DNA-binding CsgD family transcriptional regulator
MNNTLTPLKSFWKGSEVLLSLTQREIEILCALADDLSSTEIAERLCLTPKSVDNYKNIIGQKLDLTGRRVLLRFAIKYRAELYEARKLRNECRKVLKSQQMSDIKAGSGYPMPLKTTDMMQGCSFFALL